MANSIHFEALVEQAKAVRLRAYAPYSKFFVGVCLVTANGTLYSGCNVENASYGLTSCAEASAISAMVSNGEQEIVELVVVGSGDEFCSPCGACRQRIREFAALDIPVHMFDSQGQHKMMTLNELLPESFGPENLS